MKGDIMCKVQKGAFALCAKIHDAFRSTNFDLSTWATNLTNSLCKFIGGK